jgi:preprotein translocase SecE subunit
VPGELEHASGEVDEFEAALVRGADGVPVDDEVEADDAVQGDVEPDDAAGDVREVRDEEPLYDVEDEDEDEDAVDEAELERQAAEAAPPGAAAAERRRRERAERERREGPVTRFIAFLRASWVELQRVQWPDRRQVAQATAVVIGFVIIAGVYLGVADRVAQELVDLIL